MSSGGLRTGVRWWVCPNDPPCGHAAVVHDIEDYDDPVPRCCAEGCRCGERPAPVTHLAPPEGGVMACCGRTPFEAPGTDRMTEDQAKVTCGRPVVSVEGWQLAFAALACLVRREYGGGGSAPGFLAELVATFVDGADERVLGAVRVAEAALAGGAGGRLVHDQQPLS